jgi:hypothetical protein
MAEHWIDAPTALRIAGDALALCKRLHAGLATAKATTLVMGDQRGEGVLIPKRFWWAEGDAALEQDWKHGDFATWIDHDEHCEAFGVVFALSGLLQIVPHEERATLARSLSVSSNPEWLTAKEARRLIYGQFGQNPTKSGQAILEQARLGFITGRAVMAQATGPTGDSWIWEEREWPVEQWFWDAFTHEGQSSQDWDLGRFAGRGSSPGGLRSVTLTGVHFLRRSLDALMPPPLTPAPAPNLGGRKPDYDWIAATNAVWGMIHRGQLKPTSQAHLEKKLIALLTVGDKEPSESSARPYAKRIWEEYSKP